MGILVFLLRPHFIHQQRDQSESHRQIRCIQDPGSDRADTNAHEVYYGEMIYQPIEEISRTA